MIEIIQVIAFILGCVSYIGAIVFLVLDFKDTMNNDRVSDNVAARKARIFLIIQGFFANGTLFFILWVVLGIYNKINLLGLQENMV